MLRLTLLVFLLAGCQKNDAGPPCDKVVDHMLEVTKQGLTGHGQREITGRKVMIDFCVQKKFSAAARRCLLAAKDLPGLASCQKLVAPNGPPPAARPRPAPPAPAAAPGSAAPAAPPAAPAPTAPAASAGSGTPPP